MTNAGENENKPGAESSKRRPNTVESYMQNTTSSRARRFIAIFLMLVLAGGIGFWAGRTVLEPPADPVDDDTASELYAVREGEVGRTATMMATAQWDREPLTPWATSGVLTSLAAIENDVIAEGDVLFTADLRSVVALEGNIPMFRDLARPMAGPDVAQLQNALGRLGFYSGEADGEYKLSTERAVRAWQRELGLGDDGVARVSDIVFIAAMPTRLTLGDDVRVGSRLAPGQQLLWRLAEAPTFRLVVPIDQGQSIESGMAVQIAQPNGTWAGEVAMVGRSADGRDIEAHLVGPSGGPICGDDCSTAVPLLGQTTYRTEIILTPATVGPVVPMAALVTTPDGRAQVTKANGETAAVSIVQAADGLAVVEGLQLGDQIMVPYPVSATTKSPATDEN